MIPSYISDKFAKPSLSCFASDRSATLLPKMCRTVTICAKCDEIHQGVVSQITSRIDVMNLKEFLAAATLAPPAIAFQYLPMKFIVSRHVEFEARTLLAKHV